MRSTYGKIALLLRWWLLCGLLLERLLVRILGSPGKPLVRASRMHIGVERVEAPRWCRPLQRALVILPDIAPYSLNGALRALTGLALPRLFPLLLFRLEQERHGVR